MKQVNIHAAKTNLSRLIEEACAGEEIIIAKAGVPVAQLRAVPRVDITFGALVGVVEINFDDFDAADGDVAAMWEPGLEIAR